MVSTPVQNISHFLKHKPAFVLFTICLVILAVSTFYFAFEIEKGDRIVDSDKKHDWISMIKHFNKVDICIGSSKWKDELNQKQSDQDALQEVIIHTPLEINNFDALNSFTKVHGILTLHEWFPISCQGKNDPPANISIYFNLPNVKSTNKSQTICVAIKGPAYYLPYFKKPPCTFLDKPRGTLDNTGILTSKLKKQTDGEFCENGSIINARFNLELNEIENYLNDDVRTQIYIHLMWLSYVLVFIIFTILIIAIVKKSEYLEKKEQTARLL